MPKASIPEQLKLDYPDIDISFDEKRNLLIMGDHKISLLLNRKELEHVNVHSASGKNYYQAVSQILYANYSLVPSENSLADQLISYREDYEKYRVQNLARDYGIGFLEDGDDVIAVKVNGDIEKPVMIEEGEHLSDKKIHKPEDDFGYLIELPPEE